MTLTLEQKQALYKRAIPPLLAQGRVSILDPEDPEDMCAYRSSDGCRCALGFLIDDEHYDVGLEGRGAWSPYVLRAVIDSNPDLNLEPSSSLSRFLEKMQLIHDGFRFKPTLFSIDAPSKFNTFYKRYCTNEA